MYDNDYLGFKFDGVHFTIFPHPSETAANVIQLTRVSEGDRYTNNLLPIGQDATVDVPGGDGTYYFGTNFKQKTFDINFAFDNLSEANIRKIRQVFSKRNSLAPLIFDENPYKYWMVKCQGMPQLKTVCFVKNEQLGNVNLIHATDLAVATTSNTWPDYTQIGERVYKGEGTVSFIAYYPFARCGSNGTSKWLSGYSTTWDSNKIFAPTLSQWSGTAGLASSQGSYDTVNGVTTLTYNPGDIEADFEVIIARPTISGGSNLFTISQNGSSSIIATTSISDLYETMYVNNDAYLLYSSKTELLEGLNSSRQQTGRLYNRFIAPNSTLFKIKLGEAQFTASNTIISLVYDYIYY